MHRGRVVQKSWPWAYTRMLPSGKGQTNTSHRHRLGLTWVLTDKIPLIKFSTMEEYSTSSLKFVWSVRIKRIWCIFPIQMQPSDLLAQKDERTKLGTMIFNDANRIRYWCTKARGNLLAITTVTHFHVNLWVIGSNGCVNLCHSSSGWKLILGPQPYFYKYFKFQICHQNVLIIIITSWTSTCSKNLVQAKLQRFIHDQFILWDFHLSRHFQPPGSNLPGNIRS